MLFFAQPFCSWLYPPTTFFSVAKLLFSNVSKMFGDCNDILESLFQHLPSILGSNFSNISRQSAFFEAHVHFPKLPQPSKLSHPAFDFERANASQRQRRFAIPNWPPTQRIFNKPELYQGGPFWCLNITYCNIMNTNMFCFFCISYCRHGNISSIYHT